VLWLREEAPWGGKRQPWDIRRGAQACRVRGLWAADGEGEVPARAATGREEALVPWLREGALRRTVRGLQAHEAGPKLRATIGAKGARFFKAKLWCDSCSKAHPGAVNLEHYTPMHCEGCKRLDTCKGLLKTLRQQTVRSCT
jgi:hypothetical protein